LNQRFKSPVEFLLAGVEAECEVFRSTQNDVKLKELRSKLHLLEAHYEVTSLAERQK
jgi:hypothetical protein